MHPTPYKVSWSRKGHQILGSEQCRVKFEIGSYEDEVLCDVVPMDVYHLLLGRPWKNDKKVVYGGHNNTYSFTMGEINHTLIPLKNEPVEVGNQVLLMDDKEYLSLETVDDKSIDQMVKVSESI